MCNSIMNNIEYILVKCPFTIGICIFIYIYVYPNVNMFLSCF